MSLIVMSASIVELTTSRNSQLDSLDIFRVVAILWVIVNHTGSEGRVDVLDRLPSANQFKDWLWLRKRLDLSWHSYYSKNGITTT
ncbi:hypothetical protein DICVIV_04693 [Dictyocaulus viviparus]|uniref:Uncharacterized protein n=1 Tax=Dictyocaulus viviparus TaxID=29172 RepID=A0A0D8XZB4_DICVI|nr:hypothetical protein DICVIV_04693 [Dictyocaulus viviparus]